MKTLTPSITTFGIHQCSCLRKKELQTYPIHFCQWVPKTEEVNGKPVKRTVLEDVAEQRDEFVQKFDDDLIKFRDHHERVLNQTHHFALLKNGLSSDQITVQIGFAENYTCKL